MKKIISTITILSLINMLGCYYQEQMNPSDFDFHNREDIRVVTKDTTYNLIGEDYYFENDTLVATLTKYLDKQTKFKFVKNIPLSEIEKIELDKTNTLTIVLTSLGLVVGILGFMIFMNELERRSN